MKKLKKTYTVYKIMHNRKVLYIGRTNNLHRRELEHNRAILKKQNSKLIYKYLIEENISTIKLKIIKVFDTLIEAKRYECYLILMDYFGKKTLLQKVPNISDR